jgi:hypothetical protein
MWTYSRKSGLKTKYGMTMEDYYSMLASQNYRCALGDCPIDDKTAHVDHDHKTGRVRGLLCRKHNSGLGMFDDDPEEMRRAIKYLETEGEFTTWERLSDLTPA